MKKCSDCGEDSVTEEIENDNVILVCMECGAIESETQELTSNNEFQGTTISDGKAYAPKGVRTWGIERDPSKPPKGMAFGKGFIQRVGGQIHFTDSMIADAQAMYEKVFYDELYFLADVEKVAMSIACIYSVARVNQYGITMKALASFLNTKNSLKRVGFYLKKLKLKYDVHLPAEGTATQIAEILKRAGMSSNVIETTKEIVLCLELALLTQGRPPHVLAYPASYFAWKACDLSNSKVSFPDYCAKQGFQVTSVVKRRKLEMEKALRAMVKELPWVQRSNVPIRIIDPYILDVVKYKTSMVARAIQSEVHRLKTEIGNDSPISEIESENTSTCSGATNTKVEHPVLVRENARKERKRLKIQTPATVFRMPPKCSTKRELQEQAKVMSAEKKLKYSCDNDNSGDEFSLGSDDDTEYYILPLDDVEEREKAYEKYREIRTRNR